MHSFSSFDTPSKQSCHHWPRSYQYYSETYQNSCKEAIGHQEIILTALDATSITSCKDVIQAFRDNEEIFVGLFRHAESLYRKSIPMPRIVNRQANRLNSLTVSPLQFFRHQGFRNCKKVEEHCSTFDTSSII